MLQLLAVAKDLTRVTIEGSVRVLYLRNATTGLLLRGSYLRVSSVGEGEKE